MTASERELIGALDRIRHATAVLHVLRCAAAGGLFAAVVSAVAAWGFGATAAAALLAGGLPGVALTAIAFWKLHPRRTRRTVARDVEVRHPAFRNVLITAAELAAHPERSNTWIRERVMDDAAKMLGAMGEGGGPPLRRAVAACSAAQLVWLVAVIGPGDRAVSLVKQTGARLFASEGSVRVIVEPPSYTLAATETLTDPERIEAVEGSRLRVTAGRDWRVRFGGSEAAGTPGAPVLDAALTRSGYLVVEPVDANGQQSRRLLAIAVTPDRTPAVSVEKPGKDLLLPDASMRIAIGARATDDFGLNALELRYTKVSGSGEQFEFVEGTLPITIARDSAVSWKADGHIDLRALGLDKGDSLVYRVVARDGRPGGASGSSDTYFVEIAGPGQVALAGVDLPPDQDRYALSQQMIVLKIERLRSREATLDRAALGEEVDTIAAEQRAVRTNFIFLMGGHVEDEEVEAEQSHEIQEGRLENRAHRDIAAAVRHMTLAERGLAAIDTAVALESAKAAVEALQRAFGHSRYILRMLPVRNRIDPARRLAREGEARGQWLRNPSPEPTPSPAARARVLLGRLVDIQRSAHPDAGKVTQLAEEMMTIAPGSAEWQEAARSVLRFRDTLTRGGAEPERTRAFDAAAARLMRQAEADALPRASGVQPQTRLWSAWAEQKR